MIIGHPRLSSLFGHIARRTRAQVVVWFTILLLLTTLAPISGGSPGLSFAHGAIQWLAADGATTTYTVSGLSFQPKALRFYWTGLGSATDAISNTTHGRRGMGFATGTASRRCVASQDQDGTGSMTCTTGFREDCVAMTLTSTPAADGLLDLNAINSDGFQLIVDDQAPADISVFWEAWGGADITVASDLSFAEPAATGNQDYTVTGFVAGATDQIVFFAGVQATGAAPTAARNDSGFCAGIAGGDDLANIVILGNQDDGSANADCDGYGRSGECVAMITVAGGNPNARAQLTQFGTDNFRLNWIARGVTNRRYIALAIKGGQWRVGSTTIDMTTSSATTTVSGLPFAQLGMSCMTRMRTEDSAGASTVEDDIILGTATGTGSRRSQGYHSNNGSGSGFISLAIDYDAVLASLLLEANPVGLVDVNAWNSDGFQLIVDGVPFGGSATAWIGYVAFGDAPVVIVRGRPAPVWLGV